MYTLYQTHCCFLCLNHFELAVYTLETSSSKSTILQITSCTLAINVSYRFCFVVFIPLVLHGLFLYFTSWCSNLIAITIYNLYSQKNQATNYEKTLVFHGSGRKVFYLSQGSAQTGAAATSMMGGASVSKIYHLPFLERWRGLDTLLGRSPYPSISHVKHFWIDEFPAFPFGGIWFLVP